MKILITGGSGFLGRRAASHFSILDYQVLIPSHAELDITDQDNVDRWFWQHRPEIALHCAAVSDTGLCQRQPEWSHRINVEGSVHLAKACAQTGTKLIFCSSDQVYHASTLPGPHSEGEALIPETAYARQKLQAEQLIAAVCPDTVSLRLSWMYSTQFLSGEHGHLLTGLHDALHDETVPIIRSVHDFRGITNADSVVRNLPAALNLPAGVYNFGAENDRDTYHTLQTVFKELGLSKMLSRLAPDKTSPPRDIRMDGSQTSSHGITFESTVAGLFRALSNCI